MTKVCVIGLGNMGKAMLDALNSLSTFSVVGCSREDDVNKKLDRREVIIIAVKPQSFDALARSITFDLSDKIVISIMAGISIDQIKSKLKTKKVIRAMPNLPLKVKQAVSGWICSDAVSTEERNTVQSILAVFGEEIEVDDEAKIDSITALSGCGPAYYYYLNKALETKALELGFSAKEAGRIVNGTFLGAAELLKNGDSCSGELIKDVASKGGSTEAALKYFDKKGLDEIVGAGVEMARKRARELNK